MAAPASDFLVPTVYEAQGIDGDKPGMTTMTLRLRRTKRLAARLVVLVVPALATAGCGVKNLPVAPQTGKTPNIVATEKRSGDTTLFGGSRDAAVKIDRISEIQSDNVVSAAEATRNPQAQRRPFILDPLLN